MARCSALDLVRCWTPGAAAPAHRRLSALLAAAGDGTAAGDDTLGERNRELLRLHRSLVGAPLDARVTCPHCAIDNEFIVPADAILATAAPPSETCVRLRVRGHALAFRLPRMGDVEAASRASGVHAVRRIVLERCRLEGDLALMTRAAIERLGRQFEALDPAANIVAALACSGCGRTVAASVDVAAFVARDLDRLVTALYREIHTIASTYGWTEATILALPAERRRRYVDLIAARRPASHELARRTS